jgi:hypothetical protein
MGLLSFFLAFRGNQKSLFPARPWKLAPLGSRQIFDTVLKFSFDAEHSTHHIAVARLEVN